MSKRYWFIKCIIFVLLVYLSSCQPEESSVRYIASGSGTLTVNYVDAMGTSQEYNGASPFEQDFSAKSGAQLSISATCGPNGTSTVDIYINGADKAHDTETAIKSSASITVP
jgi:ribose 5-phosphate isomerase